MVKICLSMQEAVRPGFNPQARSWSRKWQIHSRILACKNSEESVRLEFMGLHRVGQSRLRTLIPLKSLLYKGPISN